MLESNDKKSLQEDVQQLGNTKVVADVISPTEQYKKACKERKKIAVIILSLLIIVEVVVAVVFLYEINSNDLHNRVLREYEIRSGGRIQLSQGFYAGETDFGYFNGEGRFAFNTGAEYIGTWSENLIEGTGILQVPIEGTYEGEFSDSQKNGKGTFTWDDNTVYEGEWKDDQMCGQGTYISADGVAYEGTFESNALKDGTCTFNNKTGSYAVTYKSGTVDKVSIKYVDGSTYDGTCTGNTLTGNGKLNFISGDVYDGAFDAGKRNGQGVYKWSSGDSYDGEWADDQMAGTGTYTYSDGSYASGTFEKNIFTNGSYYIENDFGKYTFTITNGEPTAVEMSLVSGTTYSGAMSDCKLTGAAQIKYSNGDTYSGNVSDGQKSGQGTYTWTSGACYTGKWSGDQMNGSGIYSYPSGETGYKLAGNFTNGKPNGECQYYVDSSTHYQTDWLNGECVKIYE